MSAAFKWVNAGGPGQHAMQLWVGDCLVATIKKRRGSQYKWWGFKHGDDEKQGPFDNQAAATAWAEQQIAAAVT